MDINKLTAILALKSLDLIFNWYYQWVNIFRSSSRIDVARECLRRKSKALTSSKSKVVRDCVISLNEFGIHNRLSICLIKAIPLMKGQTV